MHLIAKTVLKYCVFFCFALITACGQPSKNIGDRFIVPVVTKPAEPATSKNEPPPPPPPDRPYYWGFNFIVDSSGQIYYYQLQLLRQIDGDGSAWDAPPKFIGLQPKDLVRLPVSSIGEFMYDNILPADDTDRKISLASQKDTFTSAGVAKMLPFLNDTANHVNWLFRKTTLEENTVLFYKKRGAYYDADDIHWDSTQIRFVPKLSNPIKIGHYGVKEEQARYQVAKMLYF